MITCVQADEDDCMGHQYTHPDKHSRGSNGYAARKLCIKVGISARTWYPSISW
jgi:hypothetical protein